MAYFVYSAYAGATKSGSVRGVFASRAAAMRLMRYLRDLAPNRSPHVIYGVTTSPTPRHPATHERITLYA